MKVGDRVIAKKYQGDDSIAGRLGTIVNMSLDPFRFGVQFDEPLAIGHNCGMTTTINGNCLWMELDDIINPKRLQLYIQPEDERTVTAHFYDGEELVCSSSVIFDNASEFDFAAGAYGAFDKLFRKFENGVRWSVKENGLKSINTNDVKQIKRVKRQAKVGEYIELIPDNSENPIFDLGDIGKNVFKVIDVYENAFGEMSASVNFKVKDLKKKKNLDLPESVAFDFLVSNLGDTQLAFTENDYVVLENYVEKDGE